MACSFNRSGAEAGVGVVFSKDTWLLPQVRVVIASSFTHRGLSEFEKTGTAAVNQRDTCVKGLFWPPLEQKN